MARIKTNDLQIERAATSGEIANVIGGAGFGIQFGGYGFRGGYGGFTPRSRFGGYQPAHSWHDTSHYDYHPRSIQRHGNHFHVTPGHFDLHRSGHLHHNHR